MRLPTTCLVVLVGPSGSGKSYWAARQFRPEQIVSSDRLRAMVGVDEHDQRAGTDAFELLDLIVARRMSRRLLTVVDTLGVDASRRAAYRELARRHGATCHAVVFDTPADVCRARNRGRSRQIPPKVLSGQLAAWPAVLAEVAGEGFDSVHTAPDNVELVPPDLLVGEAVATAGRSGGSDRLGFGLQVSSFPRTASHGPADSGPPLADRLSEVAAVAEAVGFSSLWVMDHMVQIPQVGRVWEDMPESWTTLAWLAARTERIRLGTLVTGVTLRNPAHLAKIVATLDVLSGGRVVCGIGLAWWEWEHHLYGWEFPPAADRYVLLEDVLQLLPVMWGAGSPPFKGRVLSVPETLCYPRPIQTRVPILVGGSGERRTLALAARYADACNLFGDPATVRRKVEVLAAHCRAAGREPAEVRVTHLSTATVAGSRRELAAAVARLGSTSEPPERAAERLGAGTVEDQIARYRALAGAGVQTAIVALPDAFTPGALEAFGEVIAAFEGGG
jgi:F420-dependent oxidoreductase-like protein